MPIVMYQMSGSAPCRLVALVAAALDLDLQLVELNLMEKEHLKPEFAKLNPQHTIPTIVDDGFVLWESRAIARYLVNKYGNGSSLYPTEPQARALVDHRLDFDLGTLYSRFGKYFYPQFLSGAKPDEESLKVLQEGLGFLNTFLESSEYAAGSELTIADLSLVATVSTIDAVGIDLEPYPNIKRWYALVKATAPGYETANQKGIDSFKQLVQIVRAKQKQ